MPPNPAVVEALQNPTVQALMRHFPGAQIVAIRDPEKERATAAFLTEVAKQPAKLAAQANPFAAMSPPTPVNPLAFPPAMAPAGVETRPFAVPEPGLATAGRAHVASPSPGMDFTPARSKFLPFAEAFEALIDAAMEAKALAEKEQYRATDPNAGRPAIGAGRLGNACMRAIAYEFHKVGVDPGRLPKGNILRTFDRGHVMEDKMAEYLRLSGFDLLTHRPDKKQIRFDIAKYDDGKGRIKGMIDGVFRSGPEFIGANDTLPIAYPALWENKELNNKKWTELSKVGLEKFDASYFFQVQMNMAYLDLYEHPAIFTAKNADTQRIYAEHIPFRPEIAQQASDKAATVVATHNPDEMPRGASSSDAHLCRWCDFAIRCWATPAVPAAPAPIWFGGQKNPLA